MKLCAGSFVELVWLKEAVHLKIERNYRIQDLQENRIVLQSLEADSLCYHIQCGTCFALLHLT